MSDLAEKRGSFNQVMEGLEDEVADMEVEQKKDDYWDYGEDESEPTEEKAEEETKEEEETEEEQEETEETDEESEEEGEEEETDEEPSITDALTEEDSTETETEDEEPITWTVKVDGKEKEVDEEELLRGWQTAQASTKRFTEAKKLHTEAQAFFKKFLEDPGAAMTDFLTKNHKGDRLKARTEVRDKFLEFLAPDLEEQMSEDEKERELFRQRREIEEQRKALEAEKAEAKSRMEREAEEEFISDLRVNIEKGIKRYKLPTDDAIWQKAGEFLDAAKTAGSTNDELLELVPTVMKRIKEDRRQAAKDLAATLSPEELEELYPEQLKQLKKKRIAKVKKKKGQKTKKSEGDTIEKTSKPKGKKPKKMRSDEVFGSIDFNDFSD